MAKIILKLKIFIRLFRTIKDLKFGQIYYQIRSKSYKPKGKEYTYSGSKNFRKINDWPTPTKKINHTVDGNSFIFLNKTGFLDDGWNSSSRSTLWNYNLHYQNYLTERNLDRKIKLDLIEKWIDENISFSKIGWDPYTSSLRIINWIKFFGDTQHSCIQKKWLSSLYTQTRNLLNNIEFHLQGNHVFANAKALFFSGIFFDDNIIALRGSKLLYQQIIEQFDSNGGHFERSPMYHSILVWDLLDIYKLINEYDLSKKYCNLQNLVKQRIISGICWYEKMSHPDGLPAFFGDSCLDTAISLYDLKSYAAQQMININITSFKENQKLKSEYLNDSGFCVLEKKNTFKLIFNTGEIAPKYQPAHSHADTLSCEISLFGKRFLVNSGVSTYEESRLRYYQRSTKSHNTLEYNNKNSSDVWKSFRVGKKAKVFNCNYEQNDKSLLVSASHNGYSNFFKTITHQREITYENSTITIKDLIDNNKSSLIFWHLHPNVKILKQSDSFMILKLEDKELKISIYGGTYEVVESFWYPSHGNQKQNFKINIKVTDIEVSTKINLL